MIRSNVVVLASALLSGALSFTPPASAQAEAIVGTWKLHALTREVIQSGQQSNVLGERPAGFIGYLQDGRMWTISGAATREKPAALIPTADEKVRLYDTMFAYTGTYRIDADKVIHRIDISLNQHWVGTDQVRFFKVEGDTLTITTPPYRSNLDGQEIRNVAVWKRVR